MFILFECDYRGRRYAGLGLPTPRDPVLLYPVSDGQLRAVVLAGGGQQAMLRAVTSGQETITVQGDDPEIHYLPPLLPSISGNSLVTGFMGTHRSKYPAPPAPDEEFHAPNWLIKGNGSWLETNGGPLNVAASAVALLEEPEVALVFVNDESGAPHYAGYTFANDLNDIGLHLQNPWGWTPYAKLCDTSMAPWLFLGEPPRTVAGRIIIERDGAAAWKGNFTCGADAIFQRVPDMVDHLFGFPGLRRAGLVSYVLLGSDKASWHQGFRIADRDRITFDLASHGVVLSNEVRYAPVAEVTASAGFIAWGSAEF